MEIIILFVVISVISSIIKSVGRSQTAQQGQVGNIPPVGVPLETPKKEEAKISAKQKNSRTQADKRVVFKKETTPTIAPRTIRTSASGINIKSINRSRLVEGIILSEILGPPKSRRSSFKN